MSILTLPPLYKKGSKGETRVWSISVIKEKADYKIRVEHGTEDGKKIVDLSNPVVGKNIGRANETKPKQQAILEATSQWKQKKARKGYTEADEDSTSYTRPMLAHKYEDKKKHVTYPAYVQPKFNGVRCLASIVNDKVVMWSRQGVEYSPVVLQELHEALKDILEPGWIFDGELYIHGAFLQDINSAVKSRKDTSKDVSYIVYDLPDLKDKYCEYRMGALHTRLPTEGMVIAASTIRVESEEELKTQEAEFIQQGYEGLMYRSSAGVYAEGHRSKDLLKVKRFVDEEFEIVSAKEGTNRESGTVVWICKLPNGETFETRPRGSLEERKKLWEDRDKYMGKKLKVKYQELSKDGVPIFPVGEAIREDWD